MAYFEAPNIAAFLRAQSREEVGYGQRFSTKCNFWNVGNVDSDPRAGGAFDSPEACGRDYAAFIDPFGNGTGRYAAFMVAVHAGEADVLTLATLIKAAGYATDPTYAQDVADKA